MTLKRIHIETNQVEEFITIANDAERIIDASRVYSLEHPEHGHTLVIMHTNGTATAFADEVRFLASGQPMTVDHACNRADLAATTARTIASFAK